MAEKSAYDWAELILGAGATITDTVFNSKDKSEVLTDTTQSSNNDEYLDLLKKVDEDVDIMLECKMRDMALFKLVRQLKCHSEYTFINETTFKL